MAVTTKVIILTVIKQIYHHYHGNVLKYALYYPVANIEIHFHHLRKKNKKTRHDNKYIVEQYENNINSVFTEQN